MAKACTAMHIKACIAMYTKACTAMYANACTAMHSKACIQKHELLCIEKHVLPRRQKHILTCTQKHDYCAYITMSYYKYTYTRVGIQKHVLLCIQRRVLLTCKLCTLLISFPWPLFAWRHFNTLSSSIYCGNVRNIVYIGVFSYQWTCSGLEPSVRPYKGVLL